MYWLLLTNMSLSLPDDSIQPALKFNFLHIVLLMNLREKPVPENIFLYAEKNNSTYTVLQQAAYFFFFCKMCFFLGSSERIAQSVCSERKAHTTLNPTW